MSNIMMPVMKSNATKNLHKILRYYICDLRVSRQIPKQLNNINNTFHNSAILLYKPDEKRKSLAIFNVPNKNKKEKSTFLNIIYTYTSEGGRKSGHVAFVYSALKYMDEYGVNRDMEVYKAILDTMPKGRFIARTLFQAEFMHYPREQQVIIDLLQKMENNGVIPDPELEQMVLNICGQFSFPVRKLRRMLYWQTKFKNLNPWPVPKPLTTDPLELAQLAIRKIASVDVQSVVTVFKTENVENSIDKTWIVSASSRSQEKLISRHPTNVAIYVEGPYRLWVSKASVDYFILCSDVLNPRSEEYEDTDDVTNLDISLWRKAKKQLAEYRSIHEQDDRIILGVCATGTSSKDSLLSWIRCLQPKNPALITIPVLFKLVRVIDDFELISSGPDLATDSKEVSGKKNIKNIDS